MPRAVGCWSVLARGADQSVGPLNDVGVGCECFEVAATVLQPNDALAAAESRECCRFDDRLHHFGHVVED